MRSFVRTLGVAGRLLVLLTLVLGVVYPLVITGLGKVMFHDQAQGSLVRDETGTVVGSRLLGQAFADADGNPLPEYFQPRPSAAGAGYDGAASSGSNLGPESPELVQTIRDRRQQIAQFNGVDETEVPADAVTASGSGLDPEISPAYAAIQVDRVAHARGVDPEAVRELVDAHTAGRQLGLVGEPRVNVLELNLALDKLAS